MMKKKLFRTIRSRMVLLFVVVLLFVLAFLGIIASSNFRELIDREMRAEFNATLEQAVMHLEYIQEDIHTLAVQISSNSEIQKYRATEDVYDRFQERDQLSKILRSYMTQTDYVLGINLIYHDGSIFSTYARTFDGINVSPDEKWMDSLLKNTNTAYSDLITINYQTFTDLPAIAYALRFNNYLYKTEDYASVIIFIKPEYFTRQLEDGFATAKNLILSSSDGSEIYSKRNSDLDKNDIEMVKKLSNGWTLSVRYSRKTLEGRYQQLMNTLLALILIFGTAAGCVIIPMILHWTEPIKKLTEMTHQVSAGDMDIQIGRVSDDEIGQLTKSFADMTESLKQHMSQQLQEEKLRSRLKMELQMARINPHFIYNTLDSVIWLARMGKTNEMVRLCKVFIAILQDTLHTDGEDAAATLSREIEIVRDYEDIQSVRYEGRFVIEYRLDPAADNVLVPKLLLQPIVENALYHGILPDDRKCGKIVIVTHKEGDRVMIRVSDDGVGMSAEKLAAMNSPDYEGVKSQMHSIGLNNIRQRLDLMFSDQCTFQMNSRPGEGTELSIFVPVLQKKERQG